MSGIRIAKGFRQSGSDSGVIDGILSNNKPFDQMDADVLGQKFTETMTEVQRSKCHGCTGAKIPPSRFADLFKISTGTRIAVLVEGCRERSFENQYAASMGTEEISDRPDGVCEVVSFTDRSVAPHLRNTA